MDNKYKYFIVIFLMVSSFAAFGGISGNGFINLDDDEYITGNNYIKSDINPESIKWAFTAVVCSNWHPLTLLSHMLDWRLFGENASGHHLVSLLLHIGAVIFLFLFLNRTTKNLWPSAFAAAFFALHPLRVESVAWAAERKDVLSMFFGLASIYTYALYSENYKLSRYFLCLTLFALSLMAKPMLVSLPFVLFLLDYWPLGRWTKASSPANIQISANKKTDKKNHKQHKVGHTKDKKISVLLTSRTLLLEKAPFIFLTIISSIVTFWAQNKSGAVTSTEQIPFFTRIANAIISYVSYLGKTFWPVDLAVFYPYEHSFSFWQVSASLLILTGVTIVVIYIMKKLPFLFVGWFWYVGTLIPVIGLVQVGLQAMADRYTYLPSIGIDFMLAWGIPLLFHRKNIYKKILFPAGTIVLAILAVLTWKQCSYWKNDIELFNQALQVTKNNDLAHNNRGSAYAELGQYQLAIKDFNKALGLNRNYIKAYNNRGIIYGKLGQYQPAIEDFNKAINLKRDYVDAYYNRGTIYGELGQYQLAIEDFNKAINLKQNYAAAYNNRGHSYLVLGNDKLGCHDAQKACALGGCKVLEWAQSNGLCH
ncbi:MAG: tetratricopeptide repeat protein [Smithella sp.]